MAATWFCCIHTAKQRSAYGCGECASIPDLSIVYVSTLVHSGPWQTVPETYFDASRLVVCGIKCSTHSIWLLGLSKQAFQRCCHMIPSRKECSASDIRSRLHSTKHASLVFTAYR